MFWFAYEKYLRHCVPNLQLLRIWQDDDDDDDDNSNRPE
jgi:hypothetical protein